MTEADLQILLYRASWRARLATGLAWALRALIASLLAVALIVLAMRLNGREFLPLPVLAALPWILSVFAGITAVMVIRPSLEKIASALDRRAGTQDHVTTWLYLRGLDAESLTGTQRGFRDAQCQSAMRAASAINLPIHAPVSLPNWSRAIWPALIILFSAILIPPGDSNPQKDRKTATGIDVFAGGGGGGTAKNAASETLREAPRIQVLSPAERLKFELIANDSELPVEMKRDALKALTDAIDGIPESSLTDADRQLRDRLRKDTGQDTPGKSVDGAASASADPKKEHPKSVSNTQSADFTTFSEVEKAWASSESNFADVRERLDKYYKSGSK